MRVQDTEIGLAMRVMNAEVGRPMGVLDALLAPEMRVLTLGLERVSYNEPTRG